MQIDDLYAVAERVGMANHFEYLRPLARQAFHLRPTSDQSQDITSKLGGHPDLPAGCAWPTHELGTYRFLGQFDFKQFPDSQLPPQGILHLFYLKDDAQEVSWQQPGFVTALYTPDPGPLRVVECPHGDPTPDPLWLEFSEVTDLPRNQHQAAFWPFDEKSTDRYEDELGPYLFSRHGHLLGYPQNWTLAYDPAPGPEWIPLLCVPSIKELGWHWNDGDALTIFIKKESLTAADFSELRCDAG